MCHPIVQTEAPHGIHLVFHECNEWRDHNGCSIFDQSRKLIAKRFTSTGGHEHKSVIAFKDIGNDLLLIALKTVKAEVFLEVFVQYLANILHYLPHEKTGKTKDNII